MVKAVILAAGRGSRLGDLTRDRPKCMVELWGKPLLHWQVEALHGAGIKDLTIVRGYMAEKINMPGVSYLENKRWAGTNMVATLMEASNILENGPTVVSYSDIVYSSNAVTALMNGTGDIRITYDPNWRQLWEMRFDDPLSDAETFKINKETGSVLEIGNRPQSYDEIQGQYVGLLYFETSGWSNVARFLETLEPSALASIDCTGMLKQLLLNYDVKAFAIPGLWLEVDSLDDINAYNALAGRNIIGRDKENKTDRIIALSINDDYDKALIDMSIKYCIDNPNDIAPLSIVMNFVNKHAMKSECNILNEIGKTHNLVFSPNMVDRISTMDSAICMVKNYYHESTKLYVAVNHSGSWSAFEAIKKVSDKPLLLADPYTFTKDDDLPSMDTEIVSLRKDIELQGDTVPSLIYSHTAIPPHLALPDSMPFQYVTMLRNPISRFVSVYYWTYKHRHADVHWVPDIIKKGATLEQYVDYFISSKTYPGGFSPCCYFYDAWNHFGLIPDEISKDILASAKYVINNYFSFVGITELYDESLFILSGLLGLKKLPLWDLLTSSGRPDLHTIDPGVIRKIESITEIDNQLYCQMRDNFEKKYSIEIEYFRKRIGSLRADEKYVEAPNII